MAWTAQHQALLDTYHAKFSLPPLNNDAARAWTRALAEQFAYSFVGEGWGHKQADPGRPPSTDCIAIASPFTGYDVIIQQGAPDQALAKNPAPINLAGQVYIPVGPIDHLSGGGGGGQQVLDYEELGGDETGKIITRQLEADYKAAKRPGLDGDSGAWSFRVCYDAVMGLPVEEAIEKHRSGDIGWLQELGLPTNTPPLPTTK